MVYSTDRSKAVVPVSLTLCCFVVYSTRRFVVCLSLCHFVLVFFSPFSIEITSLGEVRANLSAFRTFVRFVLVWICRFPLPLGVWDGLRFVIVALPGLFSYLFLLPFSLNVTYFGVAIASVNKKWHLFITYMMRKNFTQSYVQPSRKHAYIILNPINPTFI